MKQGRKNTITRLKEKITALQTQLIALQKEPEQQSKALSPHRLPYNDSRSPKNIEYKSPTFWTNNPITHDDKYSPKKRELPQVSRTTYKKELRRYVSPNLKNITNTIDHSFYQSQSTKHLIDQSSPDSKPLKQKTLSIIRKRFQFSQFGQEGRFDCSKQSKKKTFQQISNNIILNPQKQKISRRRIASSSKSPDRILTEHPESNSRFYAFPQKSVIINKKGLIQDKNRSTLSLCSSLGDLVPIKFDQNTGIKRKKSQKKHLNQYYRDNFYSQLQLE